MAWIAPAAHQAAFHSAMAQHLSAPTMAQGVAQSQGMASGPIGTTGLPSSQEAPSPVRMKVTPRLKRGLIPHTLVSAMLK